MSKYPEITPRDVGNFYGLRTWVEYGLKQSKNELGWADFRRNSLSTNRESGGKLFLVPICWLVFILNKC